MCCAPSAHLEHRKVPSQRKRTNSLTAALEKKKNSKEARLSARFLYREKNECHYETKNKNTRRKRRFSCADGQTGLVKRKKKGGKKRKKKPRPKKRVIRWRAVGEARPTTMLAGSCQCFVDNSCQTERAASRRKPRLSAPAARRAERVYIYMQFDTDCTPRRAQGILVTHARLSGRTYAVDCVWTYYKYIRPRVRRGPYRDDRVRRYGRLATRVHCPLLSLPISPSRVVCLFIYTSISQFSLYIALCAGTGKQ